MFELKYILLSIATFAVTILYLRRQKHIDEGYSSGGFSVTSGLNFYNKSICTPGDQDGASSPYCETISPVMF